MELNEFIVGTSIIWLEGPSNDLRLSIMEMYSKCNTHTHVQVNVGDIEFVDETNVDLFIVFVCARILEWVILFVFNKLFVSKFSQYFLMFVSISCIYLKVFKS